MADSPEAPAMTVPGAVRVPSVHSKRGRQAAVATLVTLGVALMGFAAVLWLGNGSPPASTTIEHTKSRAPRGHASRAAPRTGPRATHAATRVTKATKTTGGGVSRRSETLVIALITLGAFLLLAGLFFGRIQEVTLPGGAGFKLTTDTQAKVAARAVAEAKVNPDIPDNPATVKILIQTATQELEQRHREPQVSETPEGYYVAGPPVIADIPSAEVAAVVSEAAVKLAAESDSTASAPS
jgi:hypothetical protein